MDSHTAAATRHPNLCRPRGARRLAFAALAVWLSIALPAVADSQVVHVSLTTFGTRLSTRAVHAGEVTFVVVNNAADLTHEFFLVRTSLRPQDLPLDEDGRIEEDSPLIEKVIAIEDLRPGAAGRATVHLAAGHYVYFCNIDNHHMVGMRGELTVTP